MRDILGYYQNLPLHMDPIAFGIGPFSVGWYALMYLVALGVVYFLLMYRIKNDLTGRDTIFFQLQAQILDKSGLSHEKFKDLIIDFLLASFMGAVIGGRLGYILFYNPSHYLHHLMEIISPYDFSTGKFIGIYGMSYHGGLIGVALVTLVFVRKNKLNFWKFADFVVPAIPAGYFFGRIGNFLNVELYGRVTSWWIGMHFPPETGAGESLRFPSQLFEAFLEGAVLFAALWIMRNKTRFPGYFVSLYLVGYGGVRFAVEFFREPDAQIGYVLSYLTLGQIFSLAMIAGGCWLYHFQKKRKIV